MNRYRRDVACVVVMSLTGIFGLNSFAESGVKVTINDVKAEDSVYTPYYEVVTEQKHEQGAAQKWIRLGVYFTTEGGWIDEIDVTQMAAIKGGGGQTLFLAESVHYINIGPGDHYVYVYLHPSYVERYDIDAFDLDNAVKIMINSEVVATMESNKNAPKGWSTSADNTFKSYLLNHAETPFWFLNYDFKEIIKRGNNPVE